MWWTSRYAARDCCPHALLRTSERQTSIARAATRARFRPTPNGSRRDSPLTRKTPDLRGFFMEAHTGFEPVLPESALPEPLLRKLDELKARN